MGISPSFQSKMNKAMAGIKLKEKTLCEYKFALKLTNTVVITTEDFKKGYITSLTFLRKLLASSADNTNIKILLVTSTRENTTEFFFASNRGSFKHDTRQLRKKIFKFFTNS